MDGINSKERKKSTIDKLTSAGFTIDDEQLKNFRSKITGVKENKEKPPADTRNVCLAKPSTSLSQKRCDSPSLDLKWQSFLSNVFNRPDTVPVPVPQKGKSSPTPSTSTRDVMSNPGKELSRTQKRRLRKNRRLERLMHAKEKLEKCSNVSSNARCDTCASPSAGPSHRVSQNYCNSSRKGSVHNTSVKTDRCVSGTNDLSGNIKSDNMKLSAELVPSPSCSSGSNQKRGVKRQSSSVGCATDQSSGSSRRELKAESSNLTESVFGNNARRVHACQGGGSEDGAGCDVGSAEILRETVHEIVKNKIETPDVDEGSETLRNSDGKRLKLDSVPGLEEDKRETIVSESEEEEVVVIYNSGIKRSETVSVKVVEEKVGPDVQVALDFVSNSMANIHDRATKSDEKESDCKLLSSSALAKPIPYDSDCEIVSSKSVIKMTATSFAKSKTVSTDRTTVSSSVSSKSGALASKEKNNGKSSSNCTKVTLKSGQSPHDAKRENHLQEKPSTSGNSSSRDGKRSSTPQPTAQSSRDVKRSSTSQPTAQSSRDVKRSSTSQPTAQSSRNVKRSSSPQQPTAQSSRNVKRSSSPQQPTAQSSRGVKRKREETERPRPEQYVAMDCEFVGVGECGRRNALGRCSIVDYYGKVLLDIYSSPDERITDFRTRWSGIRPYHMRNAVPFESARRRIKQIIEGKIIIGHAIHNDLDVLKIAPSRENIRDTITSAKLKAMMGPDVQKSNLKTMAQCLLSRTIQNKRDGHCSVEDARASLDLFKLIERDWDGQLKGIKKRKRVVSEMESYMDDAYWLFD